MSDSEFHQKELLRHCRVCACVMKDRNGPRFSYRCEEEHNQSLLLKLGIDVKGDQPDVHPMHFCHSCRTKANQHSETIFSSLVPFDWKPHMHPSFNCTTCSLFQKQKKGGRSKKDRKNRGRPQSQIQVITQGFCAPRYHHTKGHLLSLLLVFCHR